MNMTVCQFVILSLLENCPNTEFFWSVIFCIRTEYGDFWSKYPYSVRMQENTDQEKLSIWSLFTQCICLGTVYKQLSSRLIDFSVQQNLPTPLFLTNNIKLDEITTKFNEKYKPVLHFILSFEDTSYKNYKIQLPFILFLVVLISCYISKYCFFANFQNFKQHYLKKYFRQNIFLVNEFTLTPHPFNSQNLLSVTEVVCRCSLMGKQISYKS